MASSEQKLLIYLNEHQIGTLLRKREGTLHFVYDADYVNGEEAVPLSLSMPLSQERHTNEVVSAFLWGLLPDSELVLTRWAQRFHVSPRNCFALLEAMGEDCAGAVRFVSPEKVGQVLAGGRSLISEKEIEQRLADLRRDPSLGREPGDRGQFSLAGAQSKTALQRRGSQWYLPWGSEPTTHILKSPRPDLDGHVENEHFCMRLAEMVGLSVAGSEVLRFGTEAAIVVERYDRLRRHGRLLRVHQEDMCQALSIHPARKYQSDGGPGIVEIMELLNRSSRPVEDRWRFIQAVAFNYLILGSDAHAKNYSLLLGRAGQIRLARFYDLASLLPYVKRRNDCRFAMRIDRYYRDDQIQPRHFDRTARACEFPAAEMRRMMAEMATALPACATRILGEMEDARVSHPVVRKLEKALTDRSKKIQKTFAAA